MNIQQTKDFKEIIDSLDTGYYKEKNEQLEKEINNIMMGRPRLEGINDFVSSKIVPQNEREKEINKLKNKIKDNREKSRELGIALNELKTSADKLEQLAKQDTLTRELESLLKYWRSDEMEKSDIFNENKKEYMKLYSKTNKKLTESKHKISKEMYKAIKKNYRERAHKVFDRYQSIENALKDNGTKKVDGYTAGFRIFVETKDKYNGFFDKLDQLGVKTDIINYAHSQIHNKSNSNALTWEGKEAFDKLKNIEKAEETKIEIKGGLSKLRQIKEKYTKIVELSRETWYVDQIVSAFKDTDIAKTEMYIGLQDLIREQERELYKLSSEADKLYEKTGLQDKIDLVAQLEELYAKTEELKIKIEKLKDNGKFSEAQIYEQEYFKLRYEMIKILRENPDLDNPKYNIDIKNIIKKEMELLEPEIKKDAVVVEEVNTKVDSQVVVEEKIESKPLEVEKQEEKVEPVKETNNLTEKFELEPNLQIFRTMHYQNYMKEKVLNSDLGKLSFSDYLQTVAPNLTQLIKIEQERENVARTIYRQYLIYYSSLEDKQLAMSFEEYTVRNHNFSNIDVPIEHEEEYKGMMRR